MGAQMVRALQKKMPPLDLKPDAFECILYQKDLVPGQSLKMQ